MVEETNTDSSPSSDTEKPTGSDVANDAASAPESEAPVEQSTDNAESAAPDDNNKTVDFLDKIVRNAVKKDEKSPKDPSPFLKLFGGLLNYLKNKHDKKDARENVAKILSQISAKFDGKEITPEALMSILKAMKHDPAIMELAGAKNIVATLESNPETAVEMFEDFRAQADKLANQTPESAAEAEADTTPKAPEQTESSVVDIETQGIAPNNPGAVSQQRAASPVTGTGFIAQEVETTFSTKGPEATAAEMESLATSDLDAEQTPEPTSDASGPGSSPSSSG